MGISPRIPDDAVEEDIDRLFADALATTLQIEWHDGRLRVTVKAPDEPLASRYV